jgi:5-methylcytosine-specific restriction endonuclease McrA
MTWNRHSAAVIRSSRWKGLRLMALRRDGWKCQSCGAAAREVDHIQPVRTHPERSFDLGNLQCLCTACHTRKTRLECGHPPLSEARQKWRDLAAAPMSDGFNITKHKEQSDA